MKLEEMMRDATDDTVVDIDCLTRGASSQGRGIRRRRRLTLATSGAACAVVATLAVSIAMSGTGPDAAVDPSVDTGTATQQDARPVTQVPLDGRATAALLRAAVGDRADGTFDAYAGQGTPHSGSADTYAEFVFAPAGQVGSGVVGVNVQDVAVLEGEPRSCQGYMRDCVVTRLPGGDLLRTYVDMAESAAGNDVRRVAELLSDARGLRIVVSATNGFDRSGNEWDVTRDTPVLTADQLRTVVTDARWAFEVPAQYAEQGAELTPYVDLDADRGDWLSPEEDAARG
ncbi:hypothetical protein [Nocardioides sp. InS609-2]|uniref:hypothetical protein n=1 Tax=Nocardioides sp. InS609-2 TaxID=2760705 RepID=UPI0020BE8222|nr:hypothetical protein [Nocardioides sp. InS609-2]